MKSFEEQRKVLISYMQGRMDDADWHGVCDAANDLRVLEAKDPPIPNFRPTFQLDITRRFEQMEDDVANCLLRLKVFEEHLDILEKRSRK